MMRLNTWLAGAGVSCAVLTSLTGCGGTGGANRSGPAMGIADTQATGEVRGRPALGMPIPIPDKPTQIVPFVIESPKGWFDNPDPYSRGGYGDWDRLYETRRTSMGRYIPTTESSGVRWHNAVIKDNTGPRQCTILSGRGVINRWLILGHKPERDAPSITDALVFIATISDTNKDGRLDDRDASVAILTDADGFNPRVVTPEKAQVWSVYFEPSSGLVYFLVATDSNADGVIDQADTSMPYSMHLGPGMAGPVIDEPTRKQLESWLK